MANFNLTLSPSQIEFVLKPSAAIIQAYNVVNNSDSDITLNTQILPWIPSGTDGSVNYNQALPNPNIEFSLANSDLKIGQPFVVASHSKQQIVLKIKTNSNTILSDNYYTFFVFQNSVTTSSKDTNSTATGKIGSHLLLTVSDIENPKAESVIQNFSISPKIKDVFLKPIVLSGQVKNNSNFFFKIGGKITIIKNEKTIKEFELNNDNVLNHHARNISCKETNCTLNPPLWPGHYLVKVKLDESLNSAPYETSFYVFPISPILFLSLIIGIIFAVKKLKSKSTPTPPLT